MAIEKAEEHTQDEAATPSTNTPSEAAPPPKRSLLPELTARELGISLSEDTPRILLTVGDKKLDGWRVKIPRIRFGKHVLEDVPAAILPRAESKTSPRLGRSAWQGHEVHLEVDRLEFRLVKFSERP